MKVIKPAKMKSADANRPTSVRVLRRHGQNRRATGFAFSRDVIEHLAPHALPSETSEGQTVYIDFISFHDDKPYTYAITVSSSDAPGWVLSSKVSSGRYTITVPNSLIPEALCMEGFGEVRLGKLEGEPAATFDLSSLRHTTKTPEEADALEAERPVRKRRKKAEVEADSENSETEPKREPMREPEDVEAEIADKGEDVGEAIEALEAEAEAAQPKSRRRKAA